MEGTEDTKRARGIHAMADNSMLSCTSPSSLCTGPDNTATKKSTKARDLGQSPSGSSPLRDAPRPPSALHPHLGDALGPRHAQDLERYIPLAIGVAVSGEDGAAEMPRGVPEAGYAVRQGLPVGNVGVEANLRLLFCCCSFRLRRRRRRHSDGAVVFRRRGGIKDGEKSFVL